MLMRAALERLLDVAGERQAREILAETGMRAAQVELERVVLRRFAGHLLRERAPRALVRDRLLVRGVSAATAYRLIEAALDDLDCGCLIEEASVRSDARSLASPKQLQEPALEDQDVNVTKAAAVTAAMSEAVAERGGRIWSAMRSVMLPDVADRKTRIVGALKAELADLQAKLAVVDGRLAVAAQKLTEAIAANDKAKADETAARRSLEERGLTRDVYDHQAFELLANAASAVRDANHEHRRAEKNVREAAPLRQRAVELSALLGSEARFERAVGSAIEATQADATAREALQRAEETVAAIAGMLASEEDDLRQSRESAAADLLASLRSGAAPTAVQSANRDRISTLEVASATARNELEAARLGEKAAASRLTAARAELVQAGSVLDALHILIVDAAGNEAAARVRAEVRAALEPASRAAARRLLAS